MNQPVSLLIWLTAIIFVDGWICPNVRVKRINRNAMGHICSLSLVHLHNRKAKRHLIEAKYRTLNMNNDDDDDEDFDCTDGGVSDAIPQLPPIGSSESSTNPNGLLNDEKPFVANHKFQIQYTCNICETRNTNTISRLAYRQGVVIARCRGCQNQHLIADHLGWTNYEGGFQGNETNTIEDYFANDANNKTNVTVSRVNTDVFELEKILRYNVDKSGAIIGDDGKLALE
jgi:hypothetical protein